MVAAGVLAYWFWAPTRPAPVIRAPVTSAPVTGTSVTSAAAPARSAVAPTAPVTKERRILYYRNPMGLPDTSPTPKKDPMGMDYIPVYEGEEAQAGLVSISVDKVQKLGVRVEPAGRRALRRTVRAVGTINPDERRLHAMSTKFEGYIQKLYVNTTGQYVRRGEPLMEIYSPDLVTAQQEYLIALRGMEATGGASPEVQTSMRELAESALQRLRNWDIGEAELERLRQEGKPRQLLPYRSHVSGVVLEKPSVEGQRFMPGEMLYRIAELSQVWLLADVFEQDLALVRPGQRAQITVDAYPGREFEGKVTFVYPTVTAETRTAKVRIELPNPNGLLKPSMYARVEMSAPATRGTQLVVPDSAVLDSGTRQLVLIRRGEGAFEPRTVKLGVRADGYVEVIDGVQEGDPVVVSANFLIDAESNLKAALGGFGSHAHSGGQAPAGKPGPETVAPSAPHGKH